MSSIAKTESRTAAKKAGRGRRDPAEPRAAKGRRSRGRGGRQDQRKVVLLGIHFGDSRTRVAASENGDRLRLDRDAFTNVVGVLRLKKPLARLASKSNVLVAEQATELLEQIELRKPIVSGLVSDVRVCRQFLTHLCSSIDPSSTRRLWGVASIPAVAGPEELEKAYRSLKGPLERVVVVPEPYLAAEGMRLEKCVQHERFGQDLTRASLVIDVGASTTTLCLVRGGFPGPEDQVRLELAGNAIDEKIFISALVHTPTLFLSRRMAREIKEEQAFVGDALEGAARSASDLIALTDVIRRACDALLESVLGASCSLLDRCEPAVATAISRYIVLTGGGSRIRNLPTALEQGLRTRGYQEARVLVPDDSQTLVARGALRFAQKLGEEEWQALASRTPLEIARLFSGVAEPTAGQTGGEIEALSTLDVGLRSEASPPEGQEAASARSAPAPAQPAMPGAVVTTRERVEDPAAIDIEELDLFRAL